MRDGYLALYVDKIPTTPDRRLSPNARVHHYQRYDASVDARQMARVCATDAMARGSYARKLEGDPELKLHWTIFWGKRQYRKDLDNCIGLLKYYSDGIFDALGINDKRLVEVRVDQLKAEDGIGWMQCAVIALEGDE